MRYDQQKHTVSFFLNELHYVIGRTDDSFRGTLCVQFVARGISLLQEKLETEGELRYDVWITYKQISTPLFDRLSGNMLHS